MEASTNLEDTMNRTMMMATLPLLTFGLVTGYGSHTDKASAAAATPGGDCVGGNVVRVGDKVAVSLANSALNWDTSGSVLKLTDRSNKQVELVVTTNSGGPSPALGDCLRSGSYIRFARAGDTASNRYLQAYQGSDHGGDPSHVVIGDFPDPSIYSIFYVYKPSGPLGSVIQRGDEVNIRGTQHDPWLAVGASPANGDAVGLVHHPESDLPQGDVAEGRFGNSGDDGAGN
jgi:hypothetical protein